MPSATVEDYVKAVYAVQRDTPTGEASVARLAAVLGVTKGSVTAMVRKLRDAGLVNAERYGGITLTAKGRTLAMDVVRRHRIIEVFLVEVLGFDWSEVHEEAERLEHAMSAKLLDRLDEHLGRPATDPHGDPIPDASGELRDPGGTPLAGFELGNRGVVARVSDQDPAFLDFAARHGLRPGARFTVVDRSPEAGAITVKVARKDPVTMGLDAAARISATPAPERRR
jgi:DtxR family Mn-dependent transcriptional regulator